MIPFLPTIEIVFEAQRPSFGGGVAGEIAEQAYDYVIAHGQPIQPRKSTIIMIENNLAAIAEYKATEFRPCCIQRLHNFIERVL